MRRRFFHGRVILSDQDSFSMLLLALCFLLGAFAGNGAAGLDAVYRSDELQTYLASFFSLLQSHALVSASLGYTFFSYQKYPVLVFVLGFSSFGLLLIPVVTFYQGFALSFAVSAFLYAGPENSFMIALLLFGLRCLVVLPCYFLLANDAMAFCVARTHSRRRKEKETACPRRDIMRFAFCIILLSAGAILEHAFLPKLLLFFI